MFRLGVTGGIGVGKSTVCQVFSCLGVPIYDADKRAKALYSENLKLQNTLIDRYGADIYLDGVLNREKLGSIVFSNKAELDWLNSQVHPLIFEDYEKWCSEHESAIYTIKEAAIMFESGSDKNVDAVIGIASPEDLRIKRVMQRDGVSEEDVLDRIGKQMPQDELLKRCQFVIQNNLEDSLINQVLELHRKFTSAEFHL